MPLLKSASDVWLTGDGLGLEPIRQNHFEISIIDNQGTRMPDIGQYSILSLPSISNPVQIAQYAMVNSYFPVPGIKEHGGSIPLVFRSCSNTKALEFFTAWRSRVYNAESDTVGLYMNVIGSGEITPYKPGEAGRGCPQEPEELGKKVRLEGIWPVDVLFNEFSMDAEGANLTFQVVFAVTDAYIV
jgi:hypothetical protein